VSSCGGGVRVSGRGNSGRVGGVGVRVGDSPDHRRILRRARPGRDAHGRSSAPWSPGRRGRARRIPARVRVVAGGALDVRVQAPRLAQPPRATVLQPDPAPQGRPPAIGRGAVPKKRLRAAEKPPDNSRNPSRSLRRGGFVVSRPSAPQFRKQDQGSNANNPWWPEPGSNRRPHAFQACALPTELSGRKGHLA
jgi:hypothetical protein